MDGTVGALGTGDVVPRCVGRWCAWAVPVRGTVANTARAVMKLRRGMLTDSFSSRVVAS